ncbi:MAG: HAD family hydrolase [Deltaproteobacteria bacterium]|nr:HAD family hydrolase [Deltaproteobacteria bacterium]
MSRRAIFLDRDGTINEEVGYLDHPDRIVLLPGAARAIRRINENQLPAVVITNQSGIARGYFNETAVAAIHDRLRKELKREGAYLDAIYLCPHHPEGAVPEYRRECPCRKPGTALVEKAAEDLGIDLQASFMIGDHVKDMELALAAGMTAVMVRTGHGRKQWAQTDNDLRCRIAHLAEDLAAAVEWILGEL